MIAADRARRILEQLDMKGAVEVTALAGQFGVAEETIRRDLSRLEKAARLRRTHGGAVSREKEDLPYLLRSETARTAKKAIARRASSEVRDGMTVMIDSSSTAYAVIPELACRADLTIVTNSVRICAAPPVTNHLVLSTGGELRRRSMTFAGSMAVGALSRFRADIAFIGAKALSKDGGIMDASLTDAEMKQAFIANARRTVLLVDDSKFDAESTVAVGPLSVVAGLVTNKAPSERWITELESSGVTLMLPDIVRKS